MTTEQVPTSDATGFPSGSIAADDAPAVPESGMIEPLLTDLKGAATEAPAGKEAEDEAAPSSARALSPWRRCSATVTGSRQIPSGRT